MTSANSALVVSLAERLDTAWRTKTPTQPLSESENLMDVETAYAIQSEWARMRLARGEKIIGRKIGLTAKAVQQQFGVTSPDYGALWQASDYVAKDGRAEIARSDFIQPRVEGEIAFLIGKSLRGPNVTAQDVLAATDACALGVEIVDSRIVDWRIKLFDTIADNASYGGVVLGPWDKKLHDTDLTAVMLGVHQNGNLLAEGPGSAVLGHPAISMAWLVNKLSEFNVTLEPGDIVISGSVIPMQGVKTSDPFVFSLTGQPSLSVAFV